MQDRRRSASRIVHAGAARLLAAVGALALLMLPVEYRAGAERPHPHAAFQLWADVAHGATPHRHDAGFPAVLGHEAHANHDASVAAWNGLTPDVPRVSEATPPVERAAAFASVAALAWLLLIPVLLRIVGPARRLVGQPVRPAIPPPRPVAAVA